MVDALVPKDDESLILRMRSATIAYETLEASFKAAILPSPDLRHATDTGPARLCCYSLLGHFSILLKGPEWAPTTETRKLWRTRKDTAIGWGIRWAFASRSPPEMLATLSQVCHCRQDHFHHGFHSEAHEVGIQIAVEACQRENKPEEWYSQPAMVLLWRCLEKFERIEEEKDAYLIPESSRVRPSSRRKTWPRTLDELLPCGRQTTLRSLGGLLSIRDMPMIVRLHLLIAMQTIIHLAHPVIVPLILRSPYLFQSLAKTLESIHEDWANFEKTGGPGLVDWSMEQNPIKSLNSVSRMIQHIMDYSMLPVLHNFLRFDERRLLLCCARAYDITGYLYGLMTHRQPHPISNTSPECEKLCTTTAYVFARMGGEILDMSPHLRNRVPLVPSLLKAFLNGRTTPQIHSKPINDYNLFGRSLTYLAYDQKCRRVGCRRTAADTGRKLPFCVGCRRFQYCSRDCQTKAWSHPEVPHRDLCSSIAILCTTFLMPWKHEMVRYGKHRHFVNKSSPKIEDNAEMLSYVVEKLNAWSICDSESYPCISEQYR